MVLPSQPVTSVVIIVCAPSASAIGVYAVPELKLVPFTFIVALGSVVVGVIVMVETEFATLTV